MSLIQIKVLGEGSAVQLDAEDDRTYKIKGGEDALTVDMARIGDRLIITLVRPAAALDTQEIHGRPGETLEQFDARVRSRRC